MDTESTSAPSEHAIDGQPTHAIAETLDEATLRRLFEHAPANLEVPRDVRAIFRTRMRTVGGARRAAYIIALVAMAVLGVVLLLAGSGGFAFFLVGLPLVIVLTVAGVQYSRAGDAFFDMYAAARGLAHTENGHHGANVPLFGKGDKRKWGRLLTGTIAARPATLGHYTYTEISTDSEGNRSETDYDFTFLAFELPEAVAQRFSGIYCAPRKITFGALQDKLAHDRAVTLESGAFHKRYTLRAVDDQDDIALYELFSPPFIQLLVEQVACFWEQRRGHLVFYRKGHEKEAADLDRFCLESWHVLHRYLEEFQ